jgi:tetratricopeptide (TPR) repeat protein
MVKLSRIARVEAWVAAVGQHEPGELDEPARAVNEWGLEELRFLWYDVSSLVSLVREPDVLIFFTPQERPIGTQQTNAVQQSVASPRRFPQLTYTANELGRLRAMAKKLGGRTDGRENALLRRAAVLHADIAMLAPASTVRSTARSAGLDRYIVRMDDGRQVGAETGVSHFEMGRRLLDRIGTRDLATGKVVGPEGDEVARVWYLAVETFMQSLGDLDPRNCQRALELFSKDAETLFFCGALHEVMSGDRRQAALRSANIPRGVTMLAGSRGEELSMADRLYRRALEAKPDYDEARIRYARVLGRRGRHTEAVAELQKVTSTNEPLLEYYTALFLAGELEAVGKEDQAREAYWRAIKLFPLAQSPRIALSRLGGAPADRQAARSAVLALTSEPNVDEDRADPWWTYEYDQGRHRVQLLARLYDAVRDERPR